MVDLGDLLAFGLIGYVFDDSGGIGHLGADGVVGEDLLDPGQIVQCAAVSRRGERVGYDGGAAEIGVEVEDEGDQAGHCYPAIEGGSREHV